MNIKTTSYVSQVESWLIQDIAVYKYSADINHTDQKKEINDKFNSDDAFSVCEGAENLTFDELMRYKELFTSLQKQLANANQNNINNTPENTNRKKNNNKPTLKMTTSKLNITKDKISIKDNQIMINDDKKNITDSDIKKRENNIQQENKYMDLEEENEKKEDKKNRELKETNISGFVNINKDYSDNDGNKLYNRKNSREKSNDRDSYRNNRERSRDKSNEKRYYSNVYQNSKEFIEKGQEFNQDLLKLDNENVFWNYKTYNNLISKLRYSIYSNTNTIEAANQYVQLLKKLKDLIYQRVQNAIKKYQNADFEQIINAIRKFSPLYNKMAQIERLNGSEIKYGLLLKNKCVVFHFTQKKNTEQLNNNLVQSTKQTIDCLLYILNNKDIQHNNKDYIVDILKIVKDFFDIRERMNEFIQKHKLNSNHYKINFN